MNSQYFTDSVVVKTWSTAAGSTWGSVGSFSTGETILGSLQYRSGEERTAAGGIEDYAQCVFYCRSTETIAAEDKLIYSGSTYHVKFVHTITGRLPHKKVMLEYAK